MIDGEFVGDRWTEETAGAIVYEVVPELVADTPLDEWVLYAHEHSSL